MGKMEGISSVLQLVGGERGNVSGIMAEVKSFLGGLNAEIEDWKLSVEEYPEGTRVYARLQFMLRK